jgi:hypothetical protein
VFSTKSRAQIRRTVSVTFIVAAVVAALLWYRYRREANWEVRDIVVHGDAVWVLAADTEIVEKRLWTSSDKFERVDHALNLVQFALIDGEMKPVSVLKNICGTLPHHPTAVFTDQSGSLSVFASDDGNSQQSYSGLVAGDHVQWTAEQHRPLQVFGRQVGGRYPRMATRQGGVTLDRDRAIVRTLRDGSNVDDAWLLDAFTQCDRLRNGFGNGIEVSSDRSVVLLQSSVSSSGTASNQDTENHPRQNQEVYFVRPGSTPLSYSIPDSVARDYYWPSAVMVVEGQVLLLDVGTNALTLFDVQGSVRSAARAAARSSWAPWRASVAIDAEQNRVIVTGCHAANELDQPKSVVSVIVWDIGEPFAKRHAVDLKSLSM